MGGTTSRAPTDELSLGEDPAQAADTSYSARPKPKPQPYPKPLTPRMPLCFESGADPSLPICFGSAHLSKQSATSKPQQLERISAKCTLLREWCGSDPKFWLGSAPLSKQSAKNMLPDPQQIKANWSGSAHLSKQSAIPSNRSQSLNPKP